VCTQPRRIAAVTLAKRVSQERDEVMGSLVSYAIGKDNRMTSNTRILFVTIGWLLQKLISDEKFFFKCTHVVLDEVHERSVDSDLLTLLVWDLLKQSLSGKRVEVPPKVLLMSATVDATIYTRYFSTLGLTPPTLYVGGRRYPATIYHLDDFSTQDTLPAVKGLCSGRQWLSMSFKGKQIDDDTDEALRDVAVGIIALHANLVYNGQTNGTVLVFLSGMHSIEALNESILNAASTFKYRVINKNIDEEESSGGTDICGLIEVLVLHSLVEKDDQLLAFANAIAPGVLRVILATNIAESSLTIPGVDTVIDFGRKREVVYDSKFRVSKLVEDWTSQSSAKQRAGRTGRIQAGTVWRMYPLSIFEKMSEYDIPEMLRVSLASTVLRLKVIADRVISTRGDEGDAENVCESVLSHVGETLSKVIQVPEPEQVMHAISELLSSSAFVCQTDEEIDFLEKIHQFKKIDFPAVDQVLSDIDVTGLGKFLNLIPISLDYGRLVAHGARSGAYLIHTIIMAVGLSQSTVFVQPHPLLWNSDEYALMIKKTQKGMAYYDSGYLSDIIALIPIFIDGVGESRHASSFGVNQKKIKLFVREVKEFALRLSVAMPHHKYILEEFILLMSQPRALRAKLGLTVKDVDFLCLLIAEALPTTQLFLGTLPKAKESMLNAVKKVGGAKEYSCLIYSAKEDTTEDDIKQAFGKSGKSITLVERTSMKAQMPMFGERCFDFNAQKFERARGNQTKVPRDVFCVSFMRETDPFYIKEDATKLNYLRRTDVRFRSITTAPMELQCFVTAFNRGRFRVRKDLKWRDKGSKKDGIPANHVERDIDDNIFFMNFCPSGINFGRPQDGFKTAHLDSKSSIAGIILRDGRNQKQTQLVCVAGQQIHVASGRRGLSTPLISFMNAIPDGHGLLALFLLCKFHEDSKASVKVIQEKDIHSTTPPTISLLPGAASKIPEDERPNYWIKYATCSLLSEFVTLDPMVRLDFLYSPTFLEFQKLIGSFSDCDPLDKPDMGFNGNSLAAILALMPLCFYAGTPIIELKENVTPSGEPVDPVANIQVGNSLWIKRINGIETHFFTNTSTCGEGAPSVRTKNSGAIDSGVSLNDVEDDFYSPELKNSNSNLDFWNDSKIEKAKEISEDPNGKDKDKTPEAPEVLPHETSLLCPTERAAPHFYCLVCLKTFSQWAHLQQHAKTEEKIRLKISRRSQYSIDKYPHTNPPAPQPPTKKEAQSFCSKCFRLFFLWCDCKEHLINSGYAIIDSKAERKKHSIALYTEKMEREAEKLVIEAGAVRTTQEAMEKRVTENIAKEAEAVKATPGIACYYCPKCLKTFERWLHLKLHLKRTENQRRKIKASQKSKYSIEHYPGSNPPIPQPLTKQEARSFCRKCFTLFWNWGECRKHLLESGHYTITHYSKAIKNLHTITLYNEQKAVCEAKREIEENEKSAKASTEASTEAPFTETAFTEATFIKAAPTEVALTEAAPIEAAPIEAAPTEAAPIEAAPTEAAPIEAAPTNAPIEAAPIEAAPIEAAPTEVALTEAAPIEAAPIEAAPIEAAPIEAAPIEAAPTEVAPTKAAPTKAAFTEAASTKAAPTKATFTEAASTTTTTTKTFDMYADSKRKLENNEATNFSIIVPPLQNSISTIETASSRYPNGKKKDKSIKSDDLYIVTVVKEFLLTQPNFEHIFPNIEMAIAKQETWGDLNLLTSYPGSLFDVLSGSSLFTFREEDGKKIIALMISRTVPQKESPKSNTRISQPITAKQTRAPTLSPFMKLVKEFLLTQPNHQILLGSLIVEMARTKKYGSVKQLTRMYTGKLSTHLLQSPIVTLQGKRFHCRVCLKPDIVSDVSPGIPFTYDPSLLVTEVSSPPTISDSTPVDTLKSTAQSTDEVVCTTSTTTTTTTTTATLKTTEMLFDTTIASASASTDLCQAVTTTTSKTTEILSDTTIASASASTDLRQAATTATSKTTKMLSDTTIASASASTDLCQAVREYLSILPNKQSNLDTLLLEMVITGMWTAESLKSMCQGKGKLSKYLRKNGDFIILKKKGGCFIMIE
jgi:hypothetical protein